MSAATLLILLAGVFFITTRVVRLARVWGELRRSRAQSRADELSFAAQDRSLVPEPGRQAADDDQPSSDDLGVALALALRDAESDARGQAFRLDAP